MTGELWTLTASELLEGYRSGAFSPVDALESVHARLEAVNPHINAVIAEDRHEARLQARASADRWRSGAPLSALDGVPMTIKDNLLVAGLPASWGSRLYATYIPEADEAPVARLRAAGAVFVGKTNVPEFTLQGYASNLLYGTTVNPHAAGLTPGGSTGGGAAAVAAGIAPIAIGTDGGGSLRRPAAHCGLYAFKHSAGQVARYGGFPEILLDFESVGPVARSLDDMRAVFAVLRGYDPADPATIAAMAPVHPFPAKARIAYLPRMGTAPVDPAIADAADAFRRELEAEGHVVEVIETPFDADSVATAWGRIAAAGLHAHLQSVGSREGLGQNALALDATGAALSAADYADAMATARAARIEAGRLFSRFDMLLCPSIAALAWPASEPYPPEIDNQPVGPRGHAVFTGWMNVAGLCAASVPVTMTERGGIGLQLVSAIGRDGDLIEFLCNLPALRDRDPAPLSKEM